ncbi:uncharacterized protein EV154DRAFT_527186 [Mucor mucedo]|uniref:uncharacterized protein n=1 Tax=Mucor mucedo TaxID=29922 RepID=UPI00221E8F8E|nr:uncharacterized protein EV154DRAFT_527186 [Mucor mucedo]KAI7874432.1 hypothetical protein EV154DRAFT_527186 [Mucor mucedo]
MPLQNYSEESRQLISDFDARMRDLVQETVEKLMLAENISKAEAEEAIEFNREATQVVFRKRKSPYNAFTEKFSATRKMDTTADVQSEGLIAFQKNASTLYKALNPAEKAALVTDYQPVSKLTSEKKHLHHLEAVSEMKKIIHSYNALCGSDFLVISVFPLNEKSGNVRLIMHMLTAGEHCLSLKDTMGSELSAFLKKRNHDANERISKPYSQNGNLLRKEYSQRILELYRQFPLLHKIDTLTDILH